MSAAALPAHDSLLPRPPGGNGAGALLALLVHGGLILALTTVVDWRTRTPEAVSAELWAAVPQVAAPPPPEPQVAPPPPPPTPAVRAEPPPPREADIALEKARERKAEQERRLAKDLEEAERKRVAQQKADDKKKQAEEDKRKQEADRKKLAEAQKLQREREAQEAKADEARVAQQREANLRRMMGQAGGSAGTANSAGTAAQTAGPSGTYAGKLIGAIRRNIVFTGSLSGNPVATVEVTAAPGGSIISRRLVKSSGHKDWDDAVMRAVERTGSLPRDTDGRVPSPVTIDFNFRD